MTSMAGSLLQTAHLPRREVLLSPLAAIGTTRRRFPVMAATSWSSGPAARGLAPPRSSRCVLPRVAPCSTQPPSSSAPSKTLSTVRQWPPTGKITWWSGNRTVWVFRTYLVRAFLRMAPASLIPTASPCLCPAITRLRRRSPPAARNIWSSGLKAAVWARPIFTERAFRAPERSATRAAC